MTTAEAAVRLGMKPRSVTTMIEKGYINARKHGRDWDISQEEVDRYNRERRPRGRPSGRETMLKRMGVTFDKSGHASYGGMTTDPYGTLSFTIGTGDDFHCFDYLALPGGYIALHAVVNSETASFIQDASYAIVPLGEAQATIETMIEAAWDWCREGEVFRETSAQDDPTPDEQESQQNADRLRTAIMRVAGANTLE